MKHSTQNHKDHSKHSHIRRHKRSWWPVVTGVAFLAFVSLSVGYYIYNARRIVADDLIAQHIEQLKDIFIRINDRCKIKSIKQSPTPIDFLNTVSFVGSHVGPLELVYPNNWQGPYLKETLKIQDKPYEMLIAKDGYFIVPGKGVRLTNGKIIGKDIILRHDTDIDALLKDPETLLSATGKPLAARLPIRPDGFDLLIPLNPFGPDTDIHE